MKLESLQKPVLRSALAILVFAVLMQTQSRHLVFLPAILVFLALSVVFIKSLKSQETPLITRIARRARGVEKLDTEIASYTLKVTYVWILAFLALTVLHILFALFWPESLPTWKANLITWGLLLGLGIGEYAYRKWHLRRFTHPPLSHLLSAIREEIRLSLDGRPFL